MNKYDYMRIENELDNLRSPNDKPHLLTQLHATHITNASYYCDIQSVINAIKNDPNCQQFYKYVNDLLDNKL